MDSEVFFKLDTLIFMELKKEINALYYSDYAMMSCSYGKWSRICFKFYTNSKKKNKTKST